MSDLGVTSGAAGHDQAVPLLGLPVGAQVATVKQGLCQIIPVVPSLVRLTNEE